MSAKRTLGPLGPLDFFARRSISLQKKFKKRRPSKREWTSEHGWAGTYGGNAVSGEYLRHHVTHSPAPGLQCPLEDALQTRRSVLARSSSAGLLAVAVPTCVTLGRGEETKAGSSQQGVREALCVRA